MTTTKNIDFESVEVESHQLRLPSDICTNRAIFEHIFSIDTWNSIFTPAQQEKIQSHLPSEIRTNPAVAASTMQDLLSGNLSRFGLDPLKTFFNVLNMGGYDPEVNKLKNRIKRQWRRESLRRKRNDHTKLMQDIVISTQTCLHRLQDKKLSKLDSQNYLNSKPCKITKQNNHDSSKAITAKKKSNSAKPSPLRQKVAKSLHNEILAMNSAFPQISSSEDVAAPKKQILEKKPPKPKRPKLSVTPGDVSAANLKSPATPSPSTVINSSNILLSQQNSTRVGSVVMKLSDSSQPSIQMAKFPSVIPPSLLGVINVTQGPPALPNPKPYVTLNHHEAKVPPPSKESGQGATSFTQQIIQRHVMKSSPILASQLQAPIASVNRTNVAEIPSNVTQMLPSALQQGFKSLPTTLIKIEEESSSEDEFEAIEPTIYFSTTLPTITKASSSTQAAKSTVTKPSTLNARLRGGNQPKSLPAKKTVIALSTPPLLKSTSQPPIITTIVTLPTPTISTSIKTYIETSTPTVANVKVKVTNSKAVIAPTLSNKLSNININSMKMISGASLPPFVPDAHSSPCPSTTALGATTKLTTNLFPVANSRSSKILPFTMSALSQQSPTIVNTSFNTQALKATVLHGSTVQTCSSPILASGGLGVNGTTQSSLSLGVNPTLSTIASTTSSLGLQKTGSGNSTGSGTRLNLSGVLRTCVPTISPIPLTLSDLSQSLNLGLDVTGDKLEDKIDDLPVLDGNAFDSIPNLSDDLDVFDLDLVDGLCDFEVMLSEEKQYSSFFALIREVLCSTQNHRMTLACLEKTVRKWVVTTSSELNIWFGRISDWNEALPSALNFLAGNYQEIHPEDFVPYIEYKFKTKYYQWIGAGRDNDNNLLTLCNMWVENLDKLPPVKKQDGENEEHEEEEDENEDSDEHTEEVKKKYLRPKTPPPPRFVTEWTVRPSSGDEKDEFQIQEKVRFDNPHKAFTYRMHEYESVVGPVKGVYSNQTGVTNKARGHSLLVDDRPPYVTILALVRDSVARLPNGEGTRSEICEMLRDSAFLAPEASSVTLNSVVSGALDRLHYERDPCVRYDSHKKNWIYLHRDRSQEQFERLHHNRSYTKSTKSRNSNGRKSRKKTLSQSSGNNPSTSTAESSTAQSSNSSVSSTPSTTPTLSIPTASNTILGSALSQLGNSSPCTVVTSSGVNPTQTQPYVAVNTAASTPSISKATPANTIYVPVSLSSTPTIQFSIPASSGQIIMNKNLASTTLGLGGQGQPSVTSTQNQSLPSVNSLAAASMQLHNPMTTTFQGAVTVAPPLDTNKPGSTANIKLENSTPPTSTTTAQMALQQSIFVNNLFRFPNLKLPENVRFMRIHQTPVGQGQQGSLRLPQQRIVLRQGFGGQIPGQGLIIGQTPTGQMVIISATGTPSGLHTPPNSNLNFPESTSLATSTASTAMLNVVNNAAPSPLTCNVPITASTTVSAALKLNQGIVVSSNHLRSPGGVVRVSTSNLPTSIATATSRLATNFTTAASSQVSSSTQPRLPQLQQLRRAMQLPLKSQQTPVTESNLSLDSNQILSNSPVALRSNQIEYLIPGHHHVALGRGGVHGLKMIPVSTSGNQIFARLVAPSQGIAINSAQASTNSSSQAQQ